MSEPYHDVKVACSNCGATFTTRLEAETNYCEDCKVPHWQATLPCPLCQGETRVTSITTKQPIESMHEEEAEQ